MRNEKSDFPADEDEFATQSHWEYRREKILRKYGLWERYGEIGEPDYDKIELDDEDD